MPATLQLHHERVDDIPLLWGVVQQLGLPELLERHLGSHHFHQGLTNGTLAAVWIAALLSQANHCKVTVQDWAQRHHHTLQTLLGQELRPVEFSDDRLGILLKRFHHADWEALEADLWQATCQVYQLPLDCVRLDSSTSFGYHTPTADGLLQFGHSKDHRPDLPQLKLMAAAAQPTCQLIACDLHPGNAADDPLYLPLIRRVRRQLQRQGLLYCGDCKMAALATRAEVVAGHDYYLMPLPKVGDNAAQIETWIEEALAGKYPRQELTRVNDKREVELFAYGYEQERVCVAEVDQQRLAWTERVQIVQSLALAQRQAEQLEKRLGQAERALRALTPAPGQGRKQQRVEEELRRAVATIMQEHEVSGLLRVGWEAEQEEQRRYQGRGRPRAQQTACVEVRVRYVIKAVGREEERIAAAKQRYGWRVQVTNMPATRCDLLAAVLLYNGGWSVERDFHLLKDLPLGIQPLYVREEEQIGGLTKLLTIALRVLTLIELQVRAGLQEAGEELAGLYEGQAKRATSRPTSVRLLKAIARLEITVTRLETEEEVGWHLTPLPPLVQRILGFLKLPWTLYTCLADESG